MINIFDDAKQLPSDFVYFIPQDNKTVSMMIPILPPMVIYNDDSYKNYLSDFVSVYFDLKPDRSDPVGKIWILHKQIAFYCFALEPFIEAIAEQQFVSLIPYCAEEGFPKHEVFGVVLPVSIKTDDIPS